MHATALKHEFTRRRALGATAVVAGTGLLAACGDGESAVSAKTVDATIEASKVPVGGGYVDGTTGYVVTQPTKGQYKAFSSVCTHAGCAVGSVGDGAIKCPCHGSKFDATSGKVLAGPAEKALPSKKVTLTGTSLHVTG